MNKATRIVLIVITTIAAVYFSLFTFYSASGETKTVTTDCSYYFNFLGSPDDPCYGGKESYNTTVKTFEPRNTTNLVVIPLIALVYLAVIWLLSAVGHYHFRSLTAGLVLIGAATIFISPLSIGYVKENNKVKVIEKAKAAAEAQAEKATEEFLSKPIYFNPAVLDINGKFDLDKCMYLMNDGGECSSSTPF